MSGKFNQPITATGVQWYTPQGPAGIFDKYQQQIVCIVTVSHGKKKKSTLHLTEAVFATLGRPSFVRVGQAGSSIVLCKSETNEGAYTVMQPKDKKGEPKGTRFLNLDAFLNKFRFESGTFAYDAHIESGMVVFNTALTPSKIR